MAGTATTWSATRTRLALMLGLLVLGLMLVPASAQAQSEEGAITGAQFTPTEDALITPIAGEAPPNGLLCAPPTASAGTEVNCGGNLDPGEVGTSQIETMDPCGNNFALENFSLDTGEDEDPLTPQQDVQFGTITVDCEEGDGSGQAGVTEDGCNVQLTSMEGEDSATLTVVCQAEGGDDGDDGGSGASDETCEESSSGEEGDFEECDDGDPEGGVDAGFGGDAGQPGAPVHLPWALGGAGLLLMGLLLGGVTLARRP